MIFSFGDENKIIPGEKGKCYLICFMKAEKILKRFLGNFSLLKEVFNYLNICFYIDNYLENIYLVIIMNIYLWLAFACLGGGIKYIDDVFDEGIHSKKVAYPLAFFLVGLWILLCILDAYAATILTAIFLSVLITGKLDTKLGIFVAAILFYPCAFMLKAFC